MTTLEIPPPSSARSGLYLTLRIMMYTYAAFHFSYVTADPDLWGHIRFGQDIWNHKAVHATDPFSYTAQGLPWINHEWLMEVLYYLIFNAFDSTGLLVFKTALGIFIVHLLSSLYFARTGNVLVYVILFSLVLPVMAPGMMVRPHLATFLGLALLVVILQNFFDGRSNMIRWTPLLMLVWVNSHGGVVAGLGIFGAITALEFLRCLKTKEKRGGLMLQYFLLSCGAVLINPYGYKLWTFFIHSLGQPRDISEWGPVALADLSHWQYKLLTLLFLATFFSPARKRVWEVAVIVLALVYGYRHQRHTVLTVILMTPYLATQFSAWMRWDLKQVYDRLSHHFHWAVHACLLAFTGFLMAVLWHKHSSNFYRIAVDPSIYPVYAGQFLEANHMEGNLVVPFNWGEYIIWKSPGTRVSVDGRFRTVYPEEVLIRNRAWAAGLPEGKALIEDPRAELVLTKKGEAPHTFMETQPGWRKIHQDPLSKIFIRITPETEKRHFFQPTTPPPWAFPG